MSAVFRSACRATRREFVPDRLRSSASTIRVAIRSFGNPLPLPTASTCCTRHLLYHTHRCLVGAANSPGLATNPERRRASLPTSPVTRYLRFPKQATKLVPPLPLPPQSLISRSPPCRPFHNLSSSRGRSSLPLTAKKLYPAFRHLSMEATSNSRGSSKRKQPPVKENDRSPKKRRSDNFDMAVNETNGHSASSPPPDDGSDSFSDEEVQVLGKTAAIAETKEWQAVIEKVVKTVVSIHFCQVASYDTDFATSSEATGFLVGDGLIMTNRHVVCAGPFWGYAIFDNHEETDVYPVYRDPVHDFGFLRFDPKTIKYMSLESLTLRPDQAKVGAEIRVVGNDAGEKLSILSGVISRLDRNAPEYDGYSDFNTNYIQAAASASGGSSGSPVVNVDGHVVALQAGGRADGASTDYFLPLDRPARALELIQQSKPVSRGTIQTQWILKPYDECRRLGLSPEWEAAVRKEFPKETGMLVAEVVLPEGPGDEKLQEGDVLIKVNDQLLTQFVRLDATLDDNVGGTCKLLIQRGGKDVEVELTIGDLHAITPDRYVSVAGASFHNLSYQQARQFAVAVKGVFVAEAAGSFKFESLDSGWTITSIDNKDTPDLDAFIEVMKGIKDRSRVVVTYKHLRDLHTHNTSIIFIDRHWTPKMTMAIRNDEKGIWDFKSLADPLPREPPQTRKANFIQMQGVEYPAAADIIRSFVRVAAIMPIKLDGFPRSRKVGFGLVIDAEQGLVIVSRAIIPYDLCDVSVTVADSIIVDAKILFMHPLQNYAIIKYDPALVDAPVKSAKLSTEMIKQGQSTIFFAYNQNLRPVVTKTSVTDITTVAIPASSSTPRYRAINLDAITIDSGLSSQCGSGALLAEDGTVQALWLTYLGERSSHSGKDVEYHLGLASPMILPVIQQIKGGIQPNLRILNVETSTMHMSQCRIMGLDEKWIERVERENPERHQLFMVRKVDAGHNDGLQEGDLILTINDKLVTRVTDMDDMYTMDSLDTVILRKRQEVRLSVPTVPTEDLDTDRAVIFCGAILHRPHHAVRQQIRKIHSDVYISGRVHGSPAYMYGLAPTNFITAVNDVKTPDLTAFIDQVNKIPDNTYFRLRVMTFDNVPWVATLKKNEHYFPTMEFVKDQEGAMGSAKEKEWRRITYDHGEPHKGVEPFEATMVDQGSGVVESG